MLKRLTGLIGLALAVSLGACANIPGGPEMTFKRVSFQQGADCKGADCASVIVAEGRMTRETPRQFAEFVQAQSNIAPTRNVVVISSPGGHVGGSLAFGLLLRELDSTVMVAKAEASPDGLVTSMRPTSCFSACAYTLMGAKRRIVPSGSRVGVHRMHTFGSGVDPTRETADARFYTAGQREVTTLKRYVAGVGVDPRVVDLAETISPDDIHVLSMDEMRAFKMKIDRPF
ncbi:MAG: hypothetical protein ACRCWO_05040 [Bosea sp. (in: a-proteobacteria)]